jgi:ABC-type antimicrobial peptide transport system permease subunit
VGDVKQGRIEDSPTFDIYIPFRQMDSTGVPWIRYRSYWVVRSTMPPQALESALRTAVHAVDPGIPVTSVHTLSQVADLAKTSRRFTLMIIGFFAGAALLLTAAGVYSVIAYGVVQRTREIGVRLALGARPGQILGLVFREGLGLVSLGAAAGVLAALGLSQFIAAQLYGVSPRDPAALAVSVVLLFLIASLACWLPARRAAKVDPIVALQAD